MVRLYRCNLYEFSAVSFEWPGLYNSVLSPILFIWCHGECAFIFSLICNVGFWFRENPGLALGFAASGGAIGQAFIPHLSGILIENSGWKSAYIDLAIIYILIALPISFLIQESPWRISARTDTIQEDTDFPLSEKEVVAWISFAVIFCCVCMSIPIMHLVPLLTDKGFSLEFATSVLMLLMFCGAFGRILEAC